MADEDDQQQPLNNDIAVVAANKPRAVSVKLAEFWQGEPALWFAQAEAQFCRGLRADYLTPSLQPATLKSVQDILTDTTADDNTLPGSRRLAAFPAPRRHDGAPPCRRAAGYHLPGAVSPAVAGGYERPSCRRQLGDPQGDGNTS